MPVTGKLISAWLLAFALLFSLVIAITRTGNPAALSSGNDSVIVSLEGQTMGTGFRILLSPRHPFSSEILVSLETAINERLQTIDRELMSTYQAGSQLSLLNGHEPGSPFKTNRELITVLSTAQTISELSGGAFDITVKPLVDLWGFGVTETTWDVPDQNSIAAVLKQTGMHKFTIDPVTETVNKREDVTIDLSAIAKGYAIDQISFLLETHGFENYLVEIGGELVQRGYKEEGELWQVGIETPGQDRQSPFLKINTGPDKMALATSGSYRNYFELNGIRYSHLINPLNGMPVSHNLVSVTVAGDSAMEADAWATALMVLGIEEGLKLANELQLAAYFISGEGDDFLTRHSDTFIKYL